MIDRTKHIAALIDKEDQETRGSCPRTRTRDVCCCERLMAAGVGTQDTGEQADKYKQRVVVQGMAECHAHRLLFSVLHSQQYHQHELFRKLCLLPNTTLSEV